MTEAREGEQQQWPLSTQQVIAQISGEVAASDACAHAQEQSSAIAAHAALILISLVALFLAIVFRLSDRAYFPGKVCVKLCQAISR